MDTLFARSSLHLHCFRFLPMLLLSFIGLGTWFLHFLRITQSETDPLIRRFLSFDRFQDDPPPFQIRAMALPLNRHRFPLSDTLRDRAILAYRPFQKMGTIYRFSK